MRVYVAGPYTADTAEQIEENVRAACCAGSTLIALGHVPFVPHLNHYIHAIDPQPYETWMAQDLQWLRLCDALLLIGRSDGADREARLAHEMGLPVWTSWAQVPRC